MIIFAVMYDWLPKLGRRVKRREEPGQQVPDKPDGAALPVSPLQHGVEGSTSLRNFSISDDSDFRLASSAQTLADGGGLSGRAKLDARHFPGRPELLGRDAEPHDG